MFNDILKNLGTILLSYEPINQIITGIVLIAKGVSFIVFFPISLFGIQLAPAIANLIYLGIIFYILMKIMDSKKWAGVVLVIMIIIGAFGGL